MTSSFMCAILNLERKSPQKRNLYRREDKGHKTVPWRKPDETGADLH